jgi:hypothetical protein
MEIASKEYKLLTNFEVMEALQAQHMEKFVSFVDHRSTTRKAEHREGKGATLNLLGHNDHGLKKYSKAKLARLEDTAWVKDNVMKQLLLQPCATQTRENIQSFVAAVRERIGPINGLEGNCLTRGELVCIINNRPTNDMEVRMCVRDSGDFDYERVDQLLPVLLELVQEHLPEPPQPPVEEEDGDQQEEPVEEEEEFASRLSDDDE